MAIKYSTGSVYETQNGRYGFNIVKHEEGEESIIATKSQYLTEGKAVEAMRCVVSFLNDQEGE